MAEEAAPESTQPRVSCELANLASTRDPDFPELVWEDGQILIRGTSKITRKSSATTFRSSFHSSKIHTESQVGTFTTKSSRHQDHAHKSNYQEMLSDLYQKDFSVLSEHRSSSYNNQLIDSHQVVPTQKPANIKRASSSSKLVEESISQHCDRQVPQSSLQQCQAFSVPFVKLSQTADSMGRPHQIFQDQNSSGTEAKTGRVNFSMFLRPPGLVKANNPSFGATGPRSCPGLSSGAVNVKENDRSSAAKVTNPIDCMLTEPVQGSKSITSLQNEPQDFVATMKQILPREQSLKESLPDEQSAAFGHRDVPENKRSYSQMRGPSSSFAPNTPRGKLAAANGMPVGQLVGSSSVCSLGASNDPAYTLRRRYEDTEGLAYLSENGSEEPEGTEKAVHTRLSKGSKRNRTAEFHNLSEKKRRDKINKKMLALQELIPNCNKVDKASMLDEAIQYLKTLQLQVQMMSMGAGVYMPQMMFPAAMQQMNAAHLANFPHMGMGMGMRMHMGVGCSPAQFPTSALSGAAASLPGITEARLNMLGFPGPMLPMSMPPSSFMCFPGRPAVPTVFEAAAPPSRSNDSNPNRP